MPGDGRKVSATFVVDELRKLRMRDLPTMLRLVGRDLVMLLIREGAININGRVLARNGPNAALARYYTQAMQANLDVERGRLITGLPEADLSARILAHRETGGTIRMKDKMLRIPLPPARTPSGFDRYAGIDLKARIGTESNPFFVLKAKTGNLFLARRTDTIKAPPKGKRRRDTDALSRSPGGVELWYLLRQQVTTKPHPWFSQAVATTRQAVPAVLEKHRARVLEQKGAR